MGNQCCILYNSCLARAEAELALAEATEEAEEALEAALTDATEEAEEALADALAETSLAALEAAEASEEA